MAQLALSNIINISISESQAGVGEYNTSNLAIFSTEVAANSFGTDGFKMYVEPTDVATDFGTSSKTYAMALAIFSQQPNILAGGGQLIVILLGHSTQHLALSGVPASGTFEVTYNGNSSVAINWNDTASAMQTKLRAVAGLEEAVVTGTLAGQSINIEMAGVYGVNPAVTISANSLAATGPVAITFTITNGVVGETLDAAITRTASLVQYFGILCTSNADEIGQADVLAAAAVVQALVKIAFFVGTVSADIEVGGLLDLLRSGTFNQSRGLYYGDTTRLVAIVYAASYAGRGLSVDFTGSNTTLTMNLKDLNGVQPDPSVNQTICNKAKAAGADIFPSLQGVAKVLSFGANSFFDQIYNRLWFKGALQVAGFNYLAQTSTKIPQTENGMDGLKGAYRFVCEQGITNQFGAPGTWTNPTTFGNQANLYANVSQVGYYIYSAPVGQQAQTDRAARKAPLVQIAYKEAGAIQESDVIVNINA